MPEPLFTISGLRGIIGADLTPELVCRVAAAFGAQVGPGAVALGRDARTSGPLLAAAASAGLTSTGIRVLDLGICPTPTVPLIVRGERLAGGLVVTASHNPPEWNGLKFIGPAGTFLVDADIRALKQRLRARELPRAAWDGLGTIESRTDAIDIHIRHILAHRYFRAPVRRRFRVGIDACNGAASVAAVRLARALGMVPVALNCTPGVTRGFPRRPEPTAGHLRALSALVRRVRLDFGVAFDPDGDRFSAVDEQGRPLGEEATVMLAADHVLSRNPGPVVVNLSTTRGVEDVAARYGAPVYRTRVGEAAVVAEMKRVGAVAGGEGNGGVILPEVNPTRDGLVALALLTQLLAERRQPLSEIARELPHYVMVKDRIEIPRRAWPRLRSRLRREFRGWRFDATDGLRITGREEWLHVRPSNTEPVVRLIAEARRHAQACALVRRARDLAG